MADYNLSFSSVSIPANSGGISVTVEEDDNSDGTTDTTETISLSDGVTSYSTTSGAFAGSGQVALSFDLGPPTDETVTASSLLPVDVTVNIPSGGFKIDTRGNGIIICHANLATPNAVVVGQTNTLSLHIKYNLAVLLEYGEWAGKYETSTMLDGTEKYTDRIPPGDNIDTILVGIEPSDDLQNNNVPAFYGVIDSISDSRNPTLDTDIVDISLTMLAAYDDYADIDAAVTDLRLD